MDRTCLEYHAYLRQSNVAWNALALVGRQYTPADDLGPEVTLELRNCTCGSTLAREVPTTDADRAVA